MKFEILKNARVIINNNPSILEKGKFIELNSEIDIKDLIRVGYIKELKKTNNKKD